MYQVFQFVIDFDGIYRVVVRSQSFGHTQGGVARKGAQLQHPVGPNHAYQHFEHAALQMSGHHLPVHQPQVAAAVNEAQRVALGRDVCQDVRFQLFVQFGGHGAGIQGLKRECVGAVVLKQGFYRIHFHE